MKLVSDDKIPNVTDFFSQCDKIKVIPGEKIKQADLKDADILLTRTITQVNSALLKNTAVKFVGSATTGVDHVDERWLSENHIAFAHAAGANAMAVAEYVFCVIASLIAEKKWSPKNSVVGIIGCGRIGRVVATLFEKLNCTVLCHDPLLTEKLNFNFVSLDELIARSNLISIHTPLTKTNSHPTFHLLDAEKLSRLQSNTVVINTARGAVIDQTALLKAENIIACLDVWEYEPHISLELLQKVFIGTPHIAGYSIDAKYRATQMIYEKAAEFFKWPIMASEIKINSDFQIPAFEYALSIYNPLLHTQHFRSSPEFTAMRKNYVLREKILLAHRS